MSYLETSVRNRFLYKLLLAMEALVRTGMSLPVGDTMISLGQCWLSVHLYAEQSRFTVLKSRLKGYNELFHLPKLRTPSRCWKPSDSFFLRWSRGQQWNSNEFPTLFFQWFRWATVIVASQCARHLYDHRQWPGARPSDLQHRGCGSEFYARCCFCDGKWYLAAE